jgi:hypothetical protein
MATDLRSTSAAVERSVRSILTDSSASIKSSLQPLHLILTAVHRQGPPRFRPSLDSRPSPSERLFSSPSWYILVSLLSGSTEASSYTLRHPRPLSHQALRSMEALGRGEFRRCPCSEREWYCGAGRAGM